MNAIPLKQPIRKQANPLLLGILAVLGLAGVGAGIISSIRGIQSNIAEDSKELASEVSSLVGKYTQSEQIVEEMNQLAQELSTVCFELLQATNQKSTDQSQVSDFNNKIGRAEYLLSAVEQHFEVLKAREHITFGLQIGGHIADVKDGLANFQEALVQAGSQAQRNRAETIPAQYQQPQEPPMRAEKPAISEKDKQDVADFLSDNFKGGTTIRNLDQVLQLVLEKASQDLGISNLTLDMLKSGNLDKMHKFFAVWRNPSLYLKNYV